MAAGWALELVLGAADFAAHPSRTARGHFFALLRDAWQTRPAMQVRAPSTPWCSSGLQLVYAGAVLYCCASAAPAAVGCSSMS